jgi:hypothetical protein
VSLIADKYNSAKGTYIASAVLQQQRVQQQHHYKKINQTIDNSAIGSFQSTYPLFFLNPNFLRDDKPPLKCRFFFKKKTSPNHVENGDSD